MEDDVEEGRVDEPVTLSSISARATSRRSLPLTREVDPRKLGYTVEMFNAQFPGLDYAVVLEQFLSWYISLGTTSRNWFEKFLSYARGAHERARVSGTNTDSVGLPIDPLQRRRQEQMPRTPEEWEVYEAEVRRHENQGE